MAAGLWLWLWLWPWLWLWLGLWLWLWLWLSGTVLYLRTQYPGFPDAAAAGGAGGVAGRTLKSRSRPLPTHPGMKYFRKETLLTWQGAFVTTVSKKHNFGWTISIALGNSSSSSSSIHSALDYSFLAHIL